jgi:UDPglucose 6-dehydrogenase
MPRIGVIGCGFVGSATAAVWKPRCEVRVYDRVKERSPNTLSEVLASDIVFVCLPTPELEDGSCDTSILDALFASLNHVKNLPCFVIRSTVPVGYTSKVSDEYGYSVLHNPEFLTARTAYIDAITPARQLIGYAGNSRLCCDDLTLAELYEERFPGVPVMRVPSDVTEMAKLVCNSFFAVKIAFFNEMYRWCQSGGNDWDMLMKCVLSDGRIAHSHTLVPGPDGQMGFGGACLIKDAKNAMTSMDEAEIFNTMIYAALMRNNWDRPTESSSLSSDLASASQPSTCSKKRTSSVRPVIEPMGL